MHASLITLDKIFRGGGGGGEICAFSAYLIYIRIETNKFNGFTTQKLLTPVERMEGLKDVNKLDCACAIAFSKFKCILSPDLDRRVLQMQEIFQFFLVSYNLSTDINHFVLSR